MEEIKMKVKKRLFNTLLATALVAVTVVTGFVHPETAKAEETTDEIEVYRLYNPDNGEHLYTTDINERNVLYETYGWGYEGIGWYAPSTGTPVYRLYNNVLCNHLYTTDLNEIKVLTSMPDTAWSVDNNNQPLFYSDGEVPIYRVYNEGLQGMHHLTTDKNEYDTLPTYGWAQEGVSLYATRLGSPKQTSYLPASRTEDKIKLGRKDKDDNSAYLTEYDSLLDGGSYFSVIDDDTALYNGKRYRYYVYEDEGRDTAYHIAGLFANEEMTEAAKNIATPVPEGFALDVEIMDKNCVYYSEDSYLGAIEKNWYDPIDDIWCGSYVRQ